MIIHSPSSATTIKTYRMWYHLIIFCIYIYWTICYVYIIITSICFCKLSVFIPSIKSKSISHWHRKSCHINIYIICFFKTCWSYCTTISIVSYCISNRCPDCFKCYIFIYCYRISIPISYRRIICIFPMIKSVSKSCKYIWIYICSYILSNSLLVHSIIGTITIKSYIYFVFSCKSFDSIISSA